MRLPEMFSALTLNIILALFSMVTAIVALSLLAIVLSKESHAERQTSSVPRFSSREKIKRAESTMVDFRNPSTFPDHFLQLNTLMFQKKIKNNQITPMSPIALEGMEKMEKQLDREEKLANRALPPLPNEISTNAVGRHRRSEVTEQPPSSFVTSSTSSDEDFSDTASTQSTDAPSSVSDGTTSDWIVEKSTIEPLAEKRIVDLECGGEVSLC